MGLRLTVLLGLVVLLPVTLAYRDAPAPEIPPPVQGPVTWVAASVDSADTAYGHAPGVDLVMLSDGIGFAAGGRALWQTTDGGRSWHAVDAPPGLLTGVAAQPDGAILVSAADGRIFQSPDGRRNWRVVHPRGGGRVNSVRSAEQGITLAVGYQLALRSSDGGTTWSRMPAPPQDWYGVAFGSTGSGYIVGGGGQALVTRDGGASWVPSTLPTSDLLYSVAAPSAKTAVAVGVRGAIFRTLDGGMVWHQVPSHVTQDLYDVRFVDERRGFAVGSFGMLLVTRDGGGSWQPENSGTLAHLRRVDVSADGSPVVAGWLRTIIIRRRQPDAFFND